MSELGTTHEQLELEKKEDLNDLKMEMETVQVKIYSKKLSIYHLFTKDYVQLETEQNPFLYIFTKLS